MEWEGRAGPQRGSWGTLRSTRALFHGHSPQSPFPSHPFFHLHLCEQRETNQKVDLDLDVRQIYNSMWPEIRHWNQNFVTTCRAISLKLKVIDLHGLGTRSLGWDPDLGSPITHLVPFSSLSPLSSCMILVSLRTQEVILKTKIFMESSSGH